MSDAIRTIFGGSKQETQSTASSTPQDMAPDEFKALRGTFSDSLLSMLKSGGGPGYEGPLNANIGANETNLLGQLMNQTGAGTQRAGVLSDTLGGKFLPGQPGGNPFLQAAIEAAQRPTLQGLEETLGRTLPGRFTLAGQQTQPQSSSAFDRAAAIATRGASQALGDIASNMSFGAYESERGRQQEAVSLDRAEVDATVTNLQAQALPRLIQELGIERGVAEFNRRSSQMLELLKTLAGVTAPTIANQQQSQSTGSGESQSGIVPGLSGFFGGKK